MDEVDDVPYGGRGADRGMSGTDSRGYACLHWTPTGTRTLGCVYVVPREYRAAAERTLTRRCAEYGRRGHEWRGATYTVLASWQEAERLIAETDVIWAITIANKAATSVFDWEDCLQASRELYQ
jgi:hypothetical protein